MKKIYFDKFITIITLICFISSCSTTSNNTTGETVSRNTDSSIYKTNYSCKEPYKSFNIKSLIPKKANENLRIKILRKTINQPLKITNNYKFPFVESIEHQGIKIIPAVIKTLNHTAISPQQDKANRKKLWQDLKQSLKVKYKIDRANLRNKQKEERILQRNNYLELLKLYPKGSSQRAEFINEQILLRQEIIDEQLDERQDLKNIYKAEIAELKKQLNGFNVKAVSDCQTNNQYCDPFSNSKIDDAYDETTNFEYLDTENSYEYDDTYVNNQPYDDSTQEGRAEISGDLSSYNLPDAQQTITKTNVSLGSCLIDEIKVQKKDDLLSFTIKRNTQSCDYKSMSFNIKTDSTPLSCGQSNEVEITNQSTNQTGHNILNDFGINLELSSNNLNMNSDKQIMLKLTDALGQEKTLKIGDLIQQSSNEEIKHNEVQFVNQYTMKEIEKNIRKFAESSANNGTTQSEINDYINRYRFSINSRLASNANKRFSIIISDDSGKDNLGNFSTIGKVILSSNCPNMSSLSSLLFEIDRAKFKTGRYNVFLVDSKNKVVLDQSNKLAPIGNFFISNLKASTYATKAPIAENSEEARIPDVSGNFYQKTIIYPAISESEFDNKIVSTNSIVNTERCSLGTTVNKLLQETIGQKYQKYVISNLLDNGQDLKLLKFAELKTKACETSNIITGAIVDLTNPDTKLNYDMFMQKRNVLLSLEIEDADCNVLASYPFAAREGTKHLINHKFNLVNISKSPQIYVKVKKLFSSTGIDKAQVNYLNGLPSNSNTSNNNDGYQPSNVLDYFAYVTNSTDQAFSPARKYYNGTRIDIEACEAKCEFNSNEKILLDNAQLSLAKVTSELDTVIASGPGFSVAGFSTKANSKTEEKITDFNTKLKNLIKAYKDCDKKLMSATVAFLERTGTELLEEELLSPRVWSAVTIGMVYVSSVALVSGTTAGYIGEYDIIVKIISLSKEIEDSASQGVEVINRTKTQDCLQYADPQKLKNIQVETTNLTNGLRFLFNDIQTRRRLGQLTQLQFSDEIAILSDKIYDVRKFEILKKSQELDKLCDSCNQSGSIDSEPNLKCRICKLSPDNRAKFKKTIEVRRAILRDVTNIKERVVGVGTVKTSSGSNITVIAHSGSDTNSRLGNSINIKFEEDTSAQTVYIAKEPVNINSTIFQTKKGTLNDAEIKVFDYVNKNYPNSILSFYSDKPTCVYCQEVITRVRNEEIKPNFNLGSVGGGPIYNGESIPEPSKLSLIEKILKQGCN